MSYALIIAGLFFLFEPCVSFIDFIPDFIGAFLIMKGLSYGACALPTLEDSKDLFRRYGIVSLIFTAGIIPMISVCSTDEAMHMVFSFSVGGIFLFYSLSAFEKLFDGIEYLKSSKNLSVKILKAKIALKVLLISKYALAFAPNLIYLWIENDNGMYEAGYYPLAPYKTVLTVFAFIISLAISIPCLVILCKFFISLKKNESFNFELNSKIASYVPNRDEIYRKNIFSFLSLVLVGVWLALPFELDSTPIIPFFVTGCLVLISLSNLKKIDINATGIKKLAIINIVLSACSYFATIYYVDTHHMYDYSIEFFVTAGIYILYLISGLLLAYALCSVLIKITSVHCGRMWESALRKHNKDVSNERRSIVFMCVLTTALLTACYIFGGISFFMQRRDYELRLIFLAAYAVFGILFTVTQSKIKTAVEDRYPQ